MMAAGWQQDSSGMAWMLCDGVRWMRDAAAAAAAFLCSCVRWMWSSSSIPRNKEKPRFWRGCVLWVIGCYCGNNSIQIEIFFVCTCIKSIVIELYGLLYFPQLE